MILTRDLEVTRKSMQFRTPEQKRHCASLYDPEAGSEVSRFEAGFRSGSIVARSESL